LPQNGTIHIDIPKKRIEEMEKLEAMMNMLLEGQEKISTRMKKLEAGQEELKAGQADLKKEFFELRSEVSQIKSDIIVIQAEQQIVSERIQAVESRVSESEGDIIEISQSLGLLSNGTMELAERVASIESAFEVSLVKMPEALAGAFAKPLHEFTKAFQDGFGMIIQLMAEKHDTAKVEVKCKMEKPFDRGRSKSLEKKSISLKSRSKSPAKKLPSQDSHFKDRDTEHKEKEKHRSKKESKSIEKTRPNEYRTRDDIDDFWSKQQEAWKKERESLKKEFEVRQKEFEAKLSVSFVRGHKKVDRKPRADSSRIFCGGGAYTSDEVMANIPEPEGGWVKAFEGPDMEEQQYDSELHQEEAEIFSVGYEAYEENQHEDYEYDKDSEERSDSANEQVYGGDY